MRIRYQGINFLRHRPPFIFIKDFDLFSGGAQTVITPKAHRLYSKFGVSGSLWFHIECSAQLFGCYRRAISKNPRRPGYLSGFRYIKRILPGEPTCLQVKEISNDMLFRSFSATWLDENGAVIILAEGSIIMPKEKIETDGIPNDLLTQSSKRLTHKFGTLVSRSRDENSAVAIIQLNPTHAVYSGHFPGNPVTPGVLLGEAMSNLALWKRGGGDIIEIVDLVFSTPVNPSDQILVRIRGSDEIYSGAIFVGNKRAVRAKLKLYTKRLVSAKTRESKF